MKVTCSRWYWKENTALCGMTAKKDEQLICKSVSHLGYNDMKKHNSG